MICTRNRDRSFRGKDKAKHFYFIAHSYTTSARAGKDELYLQTRCVRGIQPSPASQWRWRCRLASLARSKQGQGAGPTRSPDQTAGAHTKWPSAHRAPRILARSSSVSQGCQRIWANRTKNQHAFFFFSFLRGLGLYKAYEIGQRCHFLF